MKSYRVDNPTDSRFTVLVNLLEGPQRKYFLDLAGAMYYVDDWNKSGGYISIEIQKVIYVPYTVITVKDNYIAWRRQDGRGGSIPTFCKEDREKYIRYILDLNSMTFADKHLYEVIEG